MADQPIIEGIKVIGGFAGFAALAWKFLEGKQTYLRIKVQAKKDKDEYWVITEIENENRTSSKVIENAFLIVSQEQEDIVAAGNLIAKRLHIEGPVNSTNDFEMLTSETSIYIDKKIVFIPLSFYYSENESIADETITYSCYIDKTKLQPGQYSVRFYIYGEKRLHRSTQDLMIIS